jgi:hypothetical protein
MTTTEIAGYRHGDPLLAPSPVTLEDLERRKATLPFTDEDAEALRRAHDILAGQVDDILDVWYGFVGSNEHLLADFTSPDGPNADYLQRVRARFRAVDTGHLPGRV